MKVLVSLNIPNVGIRLLEQSGFEVTIWKNDDPITQDELIKRLRGVDALLCSMVDKIDSYFLNQCSHLKVISQFAVGYDNIDVEEARRLKIPVGNAPDAMNDATADIAFGLMLAASRKLCFMHKSIIAGKWKNFVPKANLGIELKNKTLGVFGLGRIGMEMAKRCKGAYEMDIIYHNRGINKEAEQLLGAKRVSFEELLSGSDVLSVHCALTRDTKGVFDADAFRRMKTSALFINTSRGPVHCEPDLITALKEAEIWGAGLDVTDPEPMSSDNPLLGMENVAISPHIGSATVEARDEMSRRAARNIIEFFEKGTVPYLVS